MRPQIWIVMIGVMTITACAEFDADYARTLLQQKIEAAPTPASASGTASASAQADPGIPDTGPVSAMVEAADEPLTVSQSCAAILERVKREAAEQLAERAEQAKQSPYAATGIGVSSVSASAPMAAPPPGAVAMGGFAAPDSYLSYSETNVQVEGIDEPDIVKTDGEHIYLLNGTQLMVFDSWPAAETKLASTFELGGDVRELFVRNGTAVIFSTVYDPSELGGVLGEDAMSRFPYFGYKSFTKISIVDASGAQPRLARELFFEGDYATARAYGDTVRAVIRSYRSVSEFYAPIEYNDPWGHPYPQADIDAQADAWLERSQQALERTTIGDWLPLERERVDGVWSTPSFRCEDLYLSSSGLRENGLTSIVSLDLADPLSPFSGPILGGYYDQAYSSLDMLVLSRSEWRYDEKDPTDQERTVLQVFALDGAETKHLASGAVRGHLASQFSIDEHGGVLRLATRQNRFEFVPIEPKPEPAGDVQIVAPPTEVRSRTDNRVLTLEPEDGKLVQLGSSPALGKEGETIQAARFIGDRAYVVTFERIDPLIVLDLSDPREPSVLGQVDIPGFSEYMHPIDADHLLTIGRNAGTDGRVLGLMLQIFDVSDATAPRRTHRFEFAPEGYSEASYNHHAFNFFRPAEESGYEGLLAFPLVSYDREFRSVLEVFDVSIETGFAQLGAIDHSAFSRDQCMSYEKEAVPGGFYCAAPPEVRRGLFVSDDEHTFVYSLSYGGLLVHDLADLDHAIASHALPNPYAVVIPLADSAPAVGMAIE